MSALPHVPAACLPDHPTARAAQPPSRPLHRPWAQVQIDDCIDCRVVVGPCTGSVFLRDCVGCTFLPLPLPLPLPLTLPLPLSRWRRSSALSRRRTR